MTILMWTLFICWAAATIGALVLWVGMKVIDWKMRRDQRRVTERMEPR